MTTCPAENVQGDRDVAYPRFGEAFKFWLKLGFISFGGPTGQIAMMHTELVEKKRWIGEDRFFHALNYCVLLPGPEAQQLAIYCGWLLHRTWGGLAAGILFVLPSVFILWTLSYLYMAWGTLPAIAAIFYGLKPAVFAIVLAAVLRIGAKALKNPVRWTIALLAFVAIFFFKIPFPVIVGSAAMIGLVGGWRWPGLFASSPGHAAADGSSRRAVIDDTQAAPTHAEPSFGRALRVALVGSVLWLAPIFVAGQAFGWRSTLAQEGVFFSKAALVTFGGAYAVLPYVAQQAVDHFSWLSTAQMLDGLGLAETTPGPLIMVLQFVGFLGGWHSPGALSPLAGATLGALLTTWATFVPCFIWVFLGAPYLEQLRNQKFLTFALSSVTAAVVGIILNLAVWFGWRVILPPTSGAVDWFAIAIAGGAFVALHRFKISVFAVIGASCLLGVIYRIIL
jgi:chromate transporter